MWNVYTGHLKSAFSWKGVQGIIDLSFYILWNKWLHSGVGCVCDNASVHPSWNQWSYFRKIHVCYQSSVRRIKIMGGYDFTAAEFLNTYSFKFRLHLIFILFWRLHLTFTLTVHIYRKQYCKHQNPNKM